MDELIAVASDIQFDLIVDNDDEPGISIQSCLTAQIATH